MLRDRRPVCLSVTCVFNCGQTVGWIKMPLGTEVCLGPGDILLDGGHSCHHQRNTAAPTFGPNGRQSQLLLSSCFVLHIIKYLWCICFCFFLPQLKLVHGLLANVYMLSPVRLSSVSVVCNIRAPYSGGSNFRQYFYGVMYLGHPLTSTENFMEIVQGELLRRGS